MKPLLKPAWFFIREMRKSFLGVAARIVCLGIVFFSLPFSVSISSPGDGGPDGFGYHWKDSDAPDGPSFDYLDISSSGTAVSGLSDDNFVGPFPIGFSFSFYGNDYTEFYISSNGFIGFDPTSGNYGGFTNREIPTDFPPNTIIAWLWDDLKPQGDTEVYYQTFPDKLVVQFVSFGYSFATNERVNAEVIIYPSGKILIQYLNFTANAPLTSATVGIENSDGLDGLNVVYNAAYLHDALAVEFSSATAPPPPPEAPTLLAPADGATNQSTTLTLSWNAVNDAASYGLQVATDALFNDKVLDESNITTTSKQIGTLANNQTYYWRVNAQNAQGTSAWSPFWEFTTKANPLVGGAISSNTKSGFRKSNQSKVFYHDGKWWAIALRETDNRWFMWRYNGSNWTATTLVQAGAGYYGDAMLNSAANKLFVFGSHKTTPLFRRFSYAGGIWSLDDGYPVTLADFANADQNNPISLVRAKNGHLWIFRIQNKILQAKRSVNSGQTWSATITVKDSLTTNNGTTDAVAFTVSGQNYIGVAYAESNTTGSKFGFLWHRDDEPATTWTDESTALTFFGNEHAYNQISLAADAKNNVYLLTRNAGFTGMNPRNTLYKRATSGIWKKFKVNSSLSWKTPALAVDATNNRLFCLGINLSTLNAEYKTCLIGQEAKLDTATTTLLFSANGDSFDDLSVPAVNVNANSGLMICSDNVTANDIWYRHIPTGNITPVVVGNIALTNNKANANSAYTIPLTLTNNGALNADSGKIYLVFPSNTGVPNTIAPSTVLVNGTPSSSVISNSNTRQVTVTTPVNLTNNQTFSVVFNAGAGLLNPSVVGSHQLTIWTSVQQTPVSSPGYNIIAATTTVTPATVTLSPNLPGTPADYTLNFNLGNQGRMLPGSSTFTVKFDNATQVTHGVLNDVKVDTVNATAVGDSGLRKITITLPSTVKLGNGAAVALFLPSSAVRNPQIHGNYTLKVSTSVETTEVTSNPFEIPFVLGRPIPNTTGKFDRSNQSKLFYHGGFWWVTAQAKDDLDWYLWKLDGDTWTKMIRIHTSSKVRPDCVLDAPNNKVFILLPGGSTTYILRLSFVSGNWAIDSGYPYPVPNFSQDSDHGISLLRASNGNLWVFRINSAILDAKRSTNGGKDWSVNIVLKTGLHHATGLTDAVVFYNYVGVGYAENSEVGSIYGFLHHKNTDPDELWTDETASIPQFSGTTSDDHICMTSYNNIILMIVKTNGGGPNTANVGLLRRNTNGNWFQHPILLSTGWTRPALVVDATNNELYVFGTRELAPKVSEMKHVPIGNYGDLLTAPIDTIFNNAADDFFDMSLSAHPVDGTMNLLICNSNETRNELWYNLINLNGAAKAQSEESAGGRLTDNEAFEGVKVYPNPFNPETFLRFHLSENTPVKLQIFNLSGQLVRTLIDSELPPGVHQRRWNGRSNAGQRVASGIYLYRLQVGEKVSRGRLQMIK